MIKQKVSIYYTPEFGTLQIIDVSIYLDPAPTVRLPKELHGKFTEITEDQNIQFELRQTPVMMTFEGKKYMLRDLNRAGEFIFESMAYAEHLTSISWGHFFAQSMDAALVLRRWDL